MNSSNSMTIFSALKFLLRLGGVSAMMVGGIESFGPPVGCWILAQRHVVVNRTKRSTKNCHFQIEAIFKRLERFALLDKSSIGNFEKVFYMSFIEAATFSMYIIDYQLFNSYVSSKPKYRMVKLRKYVRLDQVFLVLP